MRLPPRERGGFWARVGLLGTSQGKPIPFAAEEFHETSDRPYGYIQQHRSYSSDRSATTNGNRGQPGPRYAPDLLIISPMVYGNGTEPHIVTFRPTGRSSHVPVLVSPQRLVRQRLGPDVGVLWLDPRSTRWSGRTTARCPRPRCQPPRGTHPRRPICGTANSPTA